MAPIRGAVGSLLAVDSDASRDVRIHADAADVFAHAIDDEHIDGLHRQARHVLPRQFQQLRFLVGNLVRPQHLHDHRAVVRVLHKANAAENLALRKHPACTGSNQLAQSVDAESMDRKRSFPLPETDERHFHETALVTTMKIRVRFDSIDEDHAIGLVRMPVHEYVDGQISLLQLDDLHRCAHRRVHGLLGNAVRAEHLGLAFSGRATVAAHGRDDERLSATSFHVPDDFFDDGGEVVDTAASHGDRDAGARPNELIQPGQLFPQREDGIMQAIPFESLPDLRQSHDLLATSYRLPASSSSDRPPDSHT